MCFISINLFKPNSDSEELLLLALPYNKETDARIGQTPCPSSTVSRAQIQSAWLQKLYFNQHAPYQRAKQEARNTKEGCKGCLLCWSHVEGIMK